MRLPSTAMVVEVMGIARSQARWNLMGKWEGRFYPPSKGPAEAVERGSGYGLRIQKMDCSGLQTLL